MNNRFLLVISFVLPFFLFISVSHAHRVIVFAWIEGDTVHTISKFPGGNKVVDTPIAVYDESGNRLLEGKTDPQGNFSFRIPEKSALKIVLDAGAGHQGEWVLSENEIAAALGEENGLPDGKAAVEPDPPRQTARKPETAPAAELSERQMEAIVEKSLDKKLKPMMKILADMHDPGPSVQDIFGGIGYILGLFGVAALIAAKKKKNTPDGF